MEWAYQESPYSRFSISLFFIPFRRIIVFFGNCPRLPSLQKKQQREHSDPQISMMEQDIWAEKIANRIPSKQSHQTFYVQLSPPNVFYFILFYYNSLFCIASFYINKENYVLNNQLKT
ncbi:hypothetical protein B4119_2047 [Parageobacillus caldoxylosilyticus]|uniref:Uncharacterized protein n=1 Tax=Saccharococcus caldoxylosilyticus TaxID=81408 RepID=A0A150LC63_9BACL|nr:hypothetical protein B4119_2047 [Parageobacillus caldoxylosilyticus]